MKKKVNNKISKDNKIKKLISPKFFFVIKITVLTKDVAW
jgi:hypothetical protein